MLYHLKILLTYGNSLTLMSFSDLARARHLHVSLSNKLEPPWEPLLQSPSCLSTYCTSCTACPPIELCMLYFVFTFCTPLCLFGAKTLHGWMLSGVGVTSVKSVQSLSFALIVPKLNIWIALHHQSLLQMILFTSKSFNLELLSCTETRFWKCSQIIKKVLYTLSFLYLWYTICLHCEGFSMAQT